MVRHSKRGDYKPVPNAPCLNMVTMVIDEYKRSKKRLQTIYLDLRHWQMLNEELKRLLKDDYVPTDKIEFEGCDVDIQLGRLNRKAMSYKFYEAPPVTTLKTFLA